MLKVLIALQLLSLANGFSVGPPNIVCAMTVPHHGDDVKAQTSPPPVTISTDSLTYTPGGVITVTVEVKPGASAFKGYMLRAMSLDGDWFYSHGHFTDIPAGSKGQMYYGPKDSCVSHSNAETKTKVQVKWNAPAATAGNIVFVGGVVQDFSTIWVNVTSAVVTAIVLPNPPLRQVTYEAEVLMSEVTDVGCGGNKGCLLVPPNCMLSSCDVFVSWEHDSENKRVTFEMRGRAADFISVGFSNDLLMGDEPHVTCVHKDGIGSVFIGYNQDTTAKYSTRHPLDEMAEVAVTKEGDFVTCRATIQMPIKLTHPHNPTQNLSFDLVNTDNYIFTVTGPAYEAARDIKKHGLIGITSGKVALYSTDIIGGSAIREYVKIHAALLVLGWLWLTVCAGMLARHRRIAADSFCCKKPTWFQLHRAMMIVMFAATAAGVILIFVYLKAYTKTATIHAPVGLATTGLALLQILVTFCRPAPDSPRRPFFTWFHRIAALLAVVGAVTAIWLGLSLDMIPSQVGDYGKYCLYAWIAVFVVFSIILEVLGCCGKRQDPDSSVKSSKGMEMEEDRPPRRNLARGCSLFFYIMFIFFTAAPVVIMLYFLFTA